VFPLFLIWSIVSPHPPPRTSVISQVSIMTITTILLRVLNNTFDSIITIIEAPVIVVASFRLVVTNTRPQKFHILTSIFVAVWCTQLLIKMFRVTLFYWTANFQMCISSASCCLSCVVVTLKNMSNAMIDKKDSLQQLTGTNIIIISRESQRNCFLHLQLGGHEYYMKA